MYISTDLVCCFRRIEIFFVMFLEMFFHRIDVIGFESDRYTAAGMRNRSFNENKEDFCERKIC